MAGLETDVNIWTDYWPPMNEAVILLGGGLAALAALAFILMPLFRSEADTKSLRRPRPGTRHLHGLKSRDVEIRTETERQCPHCGADVDPEYDFCGECASPLP